MELKKRKERGLEMIIKKYFRLNDLTFIRTVTNPSTGKEHIVSKVNFFLKLRGYFQEEIAFSYRKEPEKTGICIFLSQWQSNYY